MRCGLPQPVGRSADVLFGGVQLLDRRTSVRQTPANDNKRMNRNSDIDTIIEALRGYVGDLDRTTADNRRAAWSLICRARKKTHDPVGGIVRLIDTIYSGHPSMKFHAKNATSIRYLLNNATRIKNDILAAREKQRAASGANLDELVDRLYGGAGDDHP